nr:hypothetical protein B0A51_15788 [Rachicladosporium sp. CCFEE 5018]
MLRRLAATSSIPRQNLTKRALVGAPIPSRGCEISGKPGRTPKEVACSLQRKIKRLFHGTPMPIKDIAGAVEDAGGPALLTVRKWIESHDDGPKPDDVRLKSRNGKKHRHNSLLRQAEAYGDDCNCVHVAIADTGGDNIGVTADVLGAPVSERHVALNATADQRSLDNVGQSSHGQGTGIAVPVSDSSLHQVLEAVHHCESLSTHVRNASSVASDIETLNTVQPERWSIDSTILANKLAAVSGQSARTVHHLLKHRSLTNQATGPSHLAPPLFTAPLITLCALLQIKVVEV